MEKSYHHSREGLHLRSAATQTENKLAAAAATATTSSSSPDFVLQWGNRKRLRCMKFSKSDRNNKHDSPGSDTPVQITNRVDRRVVRSDQIKDSNTSNGANGYFNLRQRGSSPSSRLLRNSETMKGQSNGGVKGLASPERGVAAGHDKRANLDNNHNNNVKCNKNSNINNDSNNNNNRSPSSETMNDGKKGGSPSGSDAIPAVWHPKFAISLTNKEKEEDFLVLKGSKLPQRPKKRNKFIQRNVNLISPGAWLCDLSLERYEVREKKVTKKRPRGLKAMGGSVESDSE